MLYGECSGRPKEIKNAAFICICLAANSLCRNDSLISEEYIIKIMTCAEGNKSDCQPEASSIARSRRLRTMVVVEG